VLAAQIVVGLQQRPALQDLRRRDPALRQPTVGQQLPQVPGVGLAGLGVPLAAAGEGGADRLGDVRRDAGRGQLLRTYRHPVHPSSANATSSRPANCRSQARSRARSAGDTWPRLTSPVTVPG
jgi:hypothetical protein